LCADALLDALHDIRQGTKSTRSQEEIHPVGFYCSSRREGDEWIDWSWSTDRIHNLVRAIAPPGPGARTVLDGEPLVITESEKILEAPEYIDRPGTVVGRDQHGIVVKTGDTTLKVTKIADWNGEVRNPRRPKYRIGTSFGVNLQSEIRQLSSRIDQLEQRIAHLEE
jgi:methionyl-tRNA formyltransferase